MSLPAWCLLGTPADAAVPASGGPVARNQYVVRCADGHLPEGVPPAVAAILTRQAPAAARMNTFYWSLFGGDVHAGYPGL